MLGIKKLRKNIQNNRTGRMKAHQRLREQYNYIYGHAPSSAVKFILYSKDKELKRYYKTRRLKDILAYQTELEDFNPNSKNLSKLQNLFIQCGIIPDNQINRLPTKKNRRKVNKIHQYYTRMNTFDSDEESKAMALVDIVYNTEKAQRKHPLVLHNPKDPVSQQIMALSTDNYNYKGSKQYLLHNAINKRKSISKNTYNHYFKYFHENPSTYKDTYPPKTRKQKYSHEALLSKYPKRYKALSGACLEYQKKLGLNQDDSLAYVHKQLSHRFLGRMYDDTIQEFQNNRTKELNDKDTSKQMSHQQKKQKEDKGPEM